MPVRGSGLEVAAARTTFSPKRTTAEPPACLASFPVSIVRRFPPVSSTDTEVASGFINHPLCMGRRACARIRSSRGQADARRRLGTHYAKGSRSVWNRLHTEPVALLFADTELGNYGFVPFRVVFLQVVEQTTAPAHHHEKSAARA